MDLTLFALDLTLFALDLTLFVLAILPSDLPVYNLIRF